ncbi:MFS transporter [Nocardia pseudobrasiliensis]|uniref:Putative MFS family arabinose efflux permease n=1 Tax=Nocardia pseudobrasiliensis TaxID=45979 RepID=A0A370I2S9_9NOCA|nr:MFS transporter [Nocardia pseudobrasiliensis]RDI65033.1 putative MFS family arabinose efflux permease [Nocardia pseudobrasiliensis]
MTEPQEATAPPTETRTESPIGRNTVVLVSFTAVTNLADGVTKVALPLIATTLTKSPALVSFVLLTLTLPWLFAAMHVGVLVDRADRRRLLGLANTMRIVVVAGLFAAVLADVINLPMLYGGGLVLGVAEVIALTSAGALIPDAVAPAGRERANQWLTGAETVCNEFAGPFLGGLLVAAGTAIALGSTVVAYVLSVAILLFLVGTFRVARTEDQPKVTVHEQIAEGLKFLLRHRLLRTFSIVVSVLCACWGAWFGLMPLVATSGMGLSASYYGAMVSALGVGGVFGTVIVGASNRLFGRRRVMFSNIILTLAMTAAPALTTNVWIVGAAAFLGGMGGTLWTVNSRTIGQRLVTQEMMGRYSAANRLFGWGSIPLGSAVAGLLAQWFDPKLAFGVFAIATLALIPLFLRVYTSAVETEVEAKV